MEAKDTVISWEKIRMVLQEQDRIGQRDNMFRLEAIARTQAEISFIVGVEKGRKAGIEEVVEWIREHSLFRYDGKHTDLLFSKSNWQAKLKEWGKNGEDFYSGIRANHKPQ